MRCAWQAIAVCEIVETATRVVERCQMRFSRNMRPTMTATRPRNSWSGITGDCAVRLRVGILLQNSIGFDD
jgi:hypothetical protein